MKKTAFNENWMVRCLTREAPVRTVTVPHDAMIDEPRSAGSAGEGNIGWYIGGDYEYTKRFDVPGEWEGQSILLEFEGVYHNAEVYLNGEKAAFRPYGYTNFYVDAGKFLKYGEENEVRVIARNADQPNSRWYTGTGIYRPVNLWTGGEKHIPVNGVRIRTLDYRTGKIEVKVSLSCPGEVKVEILDGDETVIAGSRVTEKKRVPFHITVPHAKLWSPEHPDLYTCRVTFGDDVVEETFGIRELAWGPENGITINGERVILRGACIHHDNGLLGACAFPEAEERKVRIHKENGYNALRMAHNPCSKAMLDACDRLGMLVMDEYVDAWYMHKTKYDYVNYLMDWWQEDLRDMVDKDYNHPSVIMYSTGNEVAETAQPRGIAFTGKMTEFLHRLDDSRPVSCGINIFFNFLSSIGFGVYSDDNAEKSAAAAEQNKEAGKKKKPVGSEFYNKLACVMGDKFMKFGATLYPCDVKTRDAYANMDVAGYNYGIWRYRHDLKKYPERLILGSETFCKDAYLFWETAKDNPRVVGDFVWSGMDYIGETGMGAPEYGDYKMAEDETQMTGANGRIDLTGKPRAEAAYTRVALEREAGRNVLASCVEPAELCMLGRVALRDAQYILGMHRLTPCYLAVYEKDEPPVYNILLDIRVLDRSFADEILANYVRAYEHEKEEIEEMLDSGKFLGGFEDGELVGFVGEHPEGAFGLLEVRPEYRRKGWAHALLAAKIAQHMKRGFVPWSEVFPDNAASLKLHEQVGFTFYPPEGMTFMNTPAFD